MSILLVKLILKKSALEKSKLQNSEQLLVLLRLEELILEVNFKVEVVPEYSFEKTLVLLNHINGAVLSFEEQKLLKIIIDGL